MAEKREQRAKENSNFMSTSTSRSSSPRSQVLRDQNQRREQNRREQHQRDQLQGDQSTDEYEPLCDGTDYRTYPARHVILRNGRWWLNRTAFDAEEWYTGRDEVRDEMPELRRRGVPHAVLTERDEHYYDYMIPHLVTREQTTHTKSTYMVQNEPNENSKGKCFNFNSNSNCFISFIGDSGACDHIIKHKIILQSYIQCEELMRSANKHDKANLRIMGKGNLNVKSASSDKYFQITGVKFSPDISENLLSFRRFVELGYVIELTHKYIHVINPLTNEILLTGNYISPTWVIELELVEIENIPMRSGLQNENRNTKQILELSQIINETADMRTETGEQKLKLWILMIQKTQIHTKIHVSPLL